MQAMHSLLKRQLKRQFGDDFDIPAEWQAFIDRVDDAYHEFDADRRMLEHSLDLSSQELLDANSEMRAVFQAIPDLVFRLDHQGVILDIKAGAAGDLMLKREHLIGKRIQDTPLPEVARQFAVAIERVIAENLAVDIEYPAVLHGQESHYEARLVPLPERQIAVIIRNVTERKQSLRLLGSAVEQSTESIVIADAQLGCSGSRYLFVNPAFTRMTGYTAAEAIGENPRLLGGPKTDRAESRRMGEVLGRGEPYAGETIAYRKDGTEFLMERHVIPLRDSSGTITHFLGMQRDITERKQAEIALRESVTESRTAQEKLRASKRFAESIATNSTSQIYLIDLETGRHTYSNRNFAERLGYSPEQIVELGEAPIQRLIHPDDLGRVIRHVAQFVEVNDNRIIDIEYRIKDANGNWRWIWARDTMFDRRPDGRAWLVMGTAQDITGRKKAEAELEAAHKQLVEASRQAGMAEIATNVLHNVGNILNSVNVSAGLVRNTLRSSQAQGLARAVKLMDEHAADLGDFLTRDPKGKLLPGYLGRVAQALALEQGRMVEELCNLTRSIDHIKGVVATQQSYAGRPSLVEPVQIGDLVEDALRMNGGALARQGVTVIRQFAPVPLVNLDRPRVLQILVNLIGNAGDAMENLPGESNRLILGVDAIGARGLRITVRDEGEGIPAQNLTRIFSHGFTTRKAGHGFGLHSCALAARQMGGALTACSGGPGKGATFTLELPVDSAQPIQ